MAVVRKFFRLGEATKESVVRSRDQGVNGNSQSMSALRVAMANDSTNFMQSSSVSDVFYSPFHISSALLIGYYKSDPHCKVILVRTVCLL